MLCSWHTELLAIVHLDAVGFFFRLRDSPGIKPAPEGAKLTLRRDLGNPKDDFAVGVFNGADMIGFLGAPIAKRAAPLLFDGASGAPLPLLALDGKCVTYIPGNKSHRFRLDISLRSIPGVQPLPDGVADDIRKFCRDCEMDPQATHAAAPKELRMAAAARQQLRAEPLNKHVTWPPPSGPPGDPVAWAEVNAPSTWESDETEIHWMCVLGLAVIAWLPSLSATSALRVTD